MLSFDKLNKKNLILCVFFIVSFLTGTLVAAATSVQELSRPGKPLVILFFEKTAQLEAAQKLVTQMIYQQNLFEALGIQFDTQKTARAATEPQIPNEVEFALFTGRNEPVERQGNMLDTIIYAKGQNQPVIMFVGGDKGGGFAELTNDAKIPLDSIHSALLFDPKIGVLDYSKILNKVYNFYAHTVTGLYRKFKPGDKEIVNGTSKIANFWCRKEIAEGKDVDVDLFTYKKDWKYANNTVDFLINNVLTMNVPAIISQTNLHFKLNWDLVCITSKAENSSIYQDMKMPIVMLNRPIDLDQGKWSNVQEGWNLPVSSVSAETRKLIELNRNREIEFDVSLKAQFMSPDGKITSPTISVVIEKQTLSGQSWSEYILQKKPSIEQLGLALVTRMFIPNKEGMDLVVIVRSADRLQVDPQFFNLNIFETETGSKIPELESSGIKPYYGIILGKGYDFLYYAVMKFKIKSEYTKLITPKASFIVYKGGGLQIDPDAVTIAKGNIPKQPNVDDKFSFVVYGDIQKQNPEHLHDNDASGSALKYLKEVFTKNESSNVDDIKLQLIVGDLVLNGSNLMDWGDVLGKYLYPMVGDCLVATAIGTHDFSSSVAALWLSSIPGMSYLRLDKMKTAWGWYFSPSMPTFGHIFYFRDPKITQNPDKNMEPNKHVEETQGYFDVGPIRFIHLPYATEEENTPAIYDDSLLANLTSRAIYGAKGGFWFQFNTTGLFMENLKKAYAAKQSERIKYIIVYGHAPLASAPQYHMSHDGLLNSYTLNQIKNSNKNFLAEMILFGMAYLGIDAYFCGHNHQYDRCSLDIKFADKNMISIPLVTIGLGTKQRTPHKIQHPSELLIKLTAVRTNFADQPQNFTDLNECKITSQVFYSGNDKELLKQDQFLPAYLKCNVLTDVIECKLLKENDELLDIFYIFPSKLKASEEKEPEMDKKTATTIETEFSGFEAAIISGITQKFKQINATPTEYEDQKFNPGIKQVLNKILSPYTGIYISGQLRTMGSSVGEMGNSVAKHIEAQIKKCIAGALKNNVDESLIIQTIDQIYPTVMRDYGVLIKRLQKITGYNFASFEINEDGKFEHNLAIANHAKLLARYIAKRRAEYFAIVPKEGRKDFDSKLKIFVHSFLETGIFAKTEYDFCKNISETYQRLLRSINGYLEQLKQSQE